MKRTEPAIGSDPITTTAQAMRWLVLMLGA
jgi:hypothetical protein